MKRKIYSNIALLSALVSILVAVFLLITFYNFHLDSEIKALRDYGNIISALVADTDEITGEALKEDINTNIRITIIDLEGAVLFDNIGEPQKMENHLNRPEVIDALELGEGEAIRKSSTLDKDSYYYASLLSNDSILRISRQGDSIYSHFMDIVPSIFLIISVILVLSFLSSSLLARKILQPVEKAAKNIEGQSDNLESLKIYDEMMPFIKKLQNQEEEIKDNVELLEERATLLSVISSSMEEGLILLDRDKKILSTNTSSIKLLEGDEELSYLGADFLKLSRNIKLYEALEKSITRKSSEELIIQHESEYTNIYINPVLTEDRLLGLVIILVDYTKKHESDRVRREFTANVSHELKTPLTSINGYAELIESGIAKEEDIKKFAGTIKKEGLRLLNLIDSIIKLSKLEEGEVANSFTSLDLYKIADSVKEKLEILAEKKSIDLKLEGKSSLIKANETMMEELIYNLIDNAIKYSNPSTSIDINIGEHDGWAFIKVRDRGIGMSEEDQERVFERFYTADKSRSKKQDSSGLGLSIVKHIVEKHQGRIELTSNLGEGTEIVVRFKSS